MDTESFNQKIIAWIFTPIEYKYFSFLHHNKDNSNIINLWSASDMFLSHETRSDKVKKYLQWLDKQTKYLWNVTHTFTIEDSIVWFINQWSKYVREKENVLITNWALTSPYLLFTNLEKEIIVCPDKFYKRQLASFRTTWKKTISIETDGEGNFILDVLEKVLESNKWNIAWLYINHNTWWYGSETYYDRLFELADRYDFLVFFDIDTIFVQHSFKKWFIDYKSLISDNKHPTRSVFILNMSKEFNVPWIRVWFCLASKELIYQRKVLQENMIFIMPKPSLDIASIILQWVDYNEAWSILKYRVMKVLEICNQENIDYILPNQWINIYIRVPNIYIKLFPENPSIFFSYTAMIHWGVVFRPGSIHWESLNMYVRCVVSQPEEKITYAFSILLSKWIFNPSDIQQQYFLEDFKKKLWIL